MGATSATGKGTGVSDKVTTVQLAIQANGPQLLIVSTWESEDLPVSPAAVGGTVTFPFPYMGDPDNYCVSVTSLNGGYSYVSALNDDGDGNFIGFDFITESECTIMYMVATKGIRNIGTY